MTGEGKVGAVRPVHEPKAWRRRLAAGAILAGLAVLLAQRVGEADVCTGIEAVEGLVVQRMSSHAEWLFPRQNSGQPTFKPPLFHWSAVALQHALGLAETTSRSLRLTSGAFALATACATMLLARALLGGDGALLAGLALAASAQFVGEGRFGRVDMALTFFETVALAAFVGWLGVRARSAPVALPGTPGGARRGVAWLYLLALAMGAAVLTKGPVGALVPGAAIVAFLLFERRPAELLAMLRPGPLLSGALVASAFYAACWWSGRFEFLQRQVEWENLRRFSGGLGRMKSWYYAVPILLNSAPISLLVPWTVLLALLGRIPARGDEPGGPERRRAGLRFLAVFWVVTVVFFSMAAYKRRAYLLPLWPPAAVLLAGWVDSLAVRWRGLAARRAFAALCAVLALVNLFLLPWKERRECRDLSLRPVAADLRATLAPDESLTLLDLDEEAYAPLLFYLGREAPLHEGGTLDEAPPGAILLTADAWGAARPATPGFVEVLSSNHGAQHMVLLRRAP